MKLFDILPNLSAFKRIRRHCWRANLTIVKSQFDFHEMMILDYPTCLQLKEWSPLFEDLIADDWEVVQ